MKRIYEWIGGFALLLFSFYFTDKISEMVIDRTALMQEIKTVSKNSDTKPIDAVVNIDDNSIIPGKYGKKIFVFIFFVYIFLSLSIAYNTIA